MPLPCFVHDAHSAFAQHAEDLKVRQIQFAGEVVGIQGFRTRETFFSWGRRIREVNGCAAFRADAAHDVGGQSGAAQLAELLRHGAALEFLWLSPPL